MYVRMTCVRVCMQMYIYIYTYIHIYICDICMYVCMSHDMHMQILIIYIYIHMICMYLCIYIYIHILHIYGRQQVCWFYFATSGAFFTALKIREGQFEWQLAGWEVGEFLAFWWACEIKTNSIFFEFTYSLTVLELELLDEWSRHQRKWNSMCTQVQRYLSNMMVKGLHVKNIEKHFFQVHRLMCCSFCQRKTHFPSLRLRVIWLRSFGLVPCFNSTLCQKTSNHIELKHLKSKHINH